MSKYTYISDASLIEVTRTMTFTQSRSCNNHIRANHQSQRVNCNLCKTTFTRADNRNIHIRTIHQGERFYCDTCGRIFTHRNNLKRYIKSVHQSVKFICEGCSKIFHSPVQETESVRFSKKSMVKKKRFNCK